MGRLDRGGWEGDATKIFILRIQKEGSVALFAKQRK